MGAVAGPIMAVGSIMSFAGQKKASDAQKAEGRALAAAQEKEGEARYELGLAQRAGAEFEAKQLDYIAGQEIVVSERQAEEERRRARLAESRAIALAAASGGGGAEDPTVARIMSDIFAEGEYRALTALWEGKERSKLAKSQAWARRYEGRTAYQAGVMGLDTSKGIASSTLATSRARSSATMLSAVSGLLQSGASIYEKYK